MKMNPPGRYAVLLVLIALLLGSANVAFGQYADTRVEHDWTFVAGDQRYGMQQIVQVPGDLRTTTIYLGSRMLTTRLRATWIAALLVGSVVSGASLATFLGMLRARRNR
jgi:hypothetical protein